MIAQKKDMKQKRLVSKYSCEKCKDIGWVEGTTGMKHCECRIKEIAKSQWKRFGVNPNKIKKIDDYVIKNDRQLKAKGIAVEYVKSFEDLKNTRENGLAFLGRSGSGKTHLAIAIGAALINKGYRVVYMPYIESISELKANVLDECTYLRIVDKYKRAELLIIDDLFKDKLKNGRIDEKRKLNEADIKHLYTIINHRYINNLPTIVSSEALPSILIELDEAIAGRILEKAGDRIISFTEKTDNYRLKGWEINK